MGGFEDDLGAVDGGVDGADGFIGDELYTDGCRQMKHGVALVHQQIDRLGGSDGSSHELESIPVLRISKQLI